MAHGGRCMGLNRMVMPTEKLRITPSSSSCHPSSHPEPPCHRERPAVAVAIGHLANGVPH